MSVPSLNICVCVCACAPIHHRLIPPYSEWDSEWMARLRAVTPREWQTLWLEFVK